MSSALNASPTLRQITFRINGMDCAEEATILRRELSGLRGVQEMAFDVVNAKMVLQVAELPGIEQAVREAVARTGMQAQPWTEAREESLWERHSRPVLAWVSGLALLIAMIDSGRDAEHFLLGLLAHQAHEGSLPLHRILLFTISILAGLWYSLPKAFASVRRGRADMNVLMVISVVGAIILSEWPEAATVAFLFALANLAESWSMGRARKAVQALLHLSPKEASVVHGDHQHAVKVENLRVGQLVLVRPGERIPTDGVVTNGRSAVDQALMTGESVPALKETGDEVFAGTINGDGALTVRVTRPHHDTTLARIVRMVEDSQRRRTQSEQWVERFASYYTPIMIGIAILTAVVPPLLNFGSWTDWFYRSMVILLTSCPCALVISTPVTMVSALTSAARKGLLVKGGMFLEVAAQVRAIAFDKTGVLTGGEPTVQQVVVLNGQDPREVVGRIAALELHSEHPLARAVVHYAERQKIPILTPELVEAMPGRGSAGVVAGEKLWVGSRRLLQEKGSADTEALQAYERISGQGQTVVVCGSGDRAIALLGITDTPRPEAQRALESLRGMGIRHIEMITGDHQQAAQAVARALPIDQARWELLPEDKAMRVGELERQFGPAAMVGDGINDTQALASASLGIALGAKATDVALETADVVMMGNDLRQLPQLFRHARRALSVVQQNVWFALATKAIFLAMASLGYATLWMAVAADMGATFLVTLNGLRLLRAEPVRD